MNRKNREAENRSAYSKAEHCKRKRSEEQTAEDVLKQALAECMQEEAERAEKKIETEGQHAFSKSFIEKMQFVLKQGRAAEEQEKKKTQRRHWGRVAAACIVCVVIAGGGLVGWQSGLFSRQNGVEKSAARTADTTGNADTTEAASESSRKDLDGGAGSKETALAQGDVDGTVDTDQSTQSRQESQEVSGEAGQEADEKQQLDLSVSVTVLEVTPTTMKVRLENTGKEEIRFGDDYEGIEVYDAASDSWRECQKQSDIAYHDIAYVMKPGQKQNGCDWSVDWSAVYGSLKTGHYRLTKYISVGNADAGCQYVQQMQITFDIP